MTKRIVALLIAVLFVVSCSMLTACSSDNTTAAPQNTTNEPTKSEAPTVEPSTPETPTVPESPVDPVDPTEPTDGDDDEWSLQPEPNRAENEDAWVKWLLDIYTYDYEYEDTLATAGYPYLVTGEPYAQPKFQDGPGNIWEHYAGTKTYHLCYQFKKLEWDGTANLGTEDYQYAWDIFYRPVDDELSAIEGKDTFAKITTAPVHPSYVWNEEDPDSKVIYRVPTYEAGMRVSMGVDAEGNAIPQMYELVFLIYNTETEEVVGWNQYYAEVNSSTMGFLQEAAELGYLTLDAE